MRDMEVQKELLKKTETPIATFRATGVCNQLITTAEDSSVISIVGRPETVCFVNASSKGSFCQISQRKN